MLGKRKTTYQNDSDVPVVNKKELQLQVAFTNHLWEIGKGKRQLRPLNTQFMQRKKIIQLQQALSVSEG